MGLAWEVEGDLEGVGSVVVLEGGEIIMAIIKANNSLAKRSITKSKSSNSIRAAAEVILEVICAGKEDLEVDQWQLQC